ncbi:unnamed protein product [Trichobilharzia regenti]|nr:unnamed protein product [Trichobilharzia regenti]
MGKYRIALIDGKNEAVICRSSWFVGPKLVVCSQDNWDNAYEEEYPKIDWKLENCEVIFETG